jgi:hypothetical protein
MRKPKPEVVDHARDIVAITGLRQPTAGACTDRARNEKLRLTDHRQAQSWPEV